MTVLSMSKLCFCENYVLRCARRVQPSFYIVKFNVRRPLEAHITLYDINLIVVLVSRSAFENLSALRLTRISN